MIGFGRFAPDRRIDNGELERRLNVEEGCIEQRTGIRSRRYAAEGEAVTDLACRAGDAALSSAGLSRAEIGLTLLATSTPDHLLPPSAPLLAARLGLSSSGAVDVTGACAGFIYALAFADGFVRTQARAVLVIGANILSRRINPADRATAALFGDAAGAVVLGPSDAASTGILGIDLASDGSGYDLIRVRAGGSRRPLAPDTVPADVAIEITRGPAVFAAAVEMMTRSARRALAAANLTGAQITRWVPHQANARIIEAVCRRLGAPAESVVSTVREYGNTSAASIPFSIAASAEADPFRPGERMLLTAAGAGLTGGALVYGF